MMIQRYLLLAAALAGALALAGACRKADDGAGKAVAVGGKAAAGGASAVEASRPAETPILFGQVFVNDLRAASLTPDLPVIVRAVFEAPQAAVAWTPGPAEKLGLAWTDGEGRAISVEVAPLAGPTPPNQARAQGAVFQWALRGPLPAGTYTVGLAIPSDWIDLHKAGLDEVRIEPASLAVAPGSADPSVKAYWERRLLLASGRAADYLKAVGEALAAAPGDSGLRLERVDGLVLAGDRPTAAKELAKLLHDIQDEQARRDPSREPHLPSWLIDYLASLKKS